MIPGTIVALGRSLATLKKSPGHTAFSFALAGLGWLVLYLGMPDCAIAVIVVADLYLALMIWCAATLSSGCAETWPGVPYRHPALFILLFVFASLVLAAAALYRDAQPTLTAPHAAFVSFVNLATFTYGDSGATAGPHGIQSLQLSSGILLLLCAFPLLISRFADFGPHLGEITFNGCRVILPGGPSAKVTVSGLNLSWRTAKHAIKVQHTPPSSFSVTSASVEESSPTHVLVINGDGTFVLRP